MPDITKEQFQDKVDEFTDTQEDAYILFKDTDGNWRGGGFKAGHFIQARQATPETVLQMLLTHDGK